MKAAKGGWTLGGHRLLARSADLAKGDKKLLAPFEGLLEANDEDEGGLELADVLEGGMRVALYAAWPVEAGALIAVKSGEVLADVVDGYFDAHGDEGLRVRMREAVAGSGIRLRDQVRFDGGRDTPRRPATLVGHDPAVLAEIGALRAELAGAKDRDVHATMAAIGALLPRVFPEALRPYPMRRPFELSEAQRRWLELVVDHYAWRLDLWAQGLPWKGAEHEEESPLSRMMGRRPAQPLDAVVQLEGKLHPLWAVASDVLVGLRSESAFFFAIEGLSAEDRAGVWRQLARGDDRLDVLHPRDAKEVQRGWADPKAQDAVRARYVELLRGVFEGLSEEVARAALSAGESDRLRLAALDGLARRAELDPAHDATIAEIVGGGRCPKQQVLALLALLPRERAAALTGLDYFLVKELPSEGAMLRVIARMTQDPEWQSAKGVWAKLVTELAAKFAEAALPALREAKTHLTRHPDGLDKAIAAAEKATKPKTKRSGR